MDLKFDKMTADTSLAQEYLENNKPLSELYEDYSGTIKRCDTYQFDGKHFHEGGIESGSIPESNFNDITRKLKNLASSLKRNSTLISQLEYRIRNIPIEDTDAQLNIIIQNLRSASPRSFQNCHACFLLYPNDSLLIFGVPPVYPRNTIKLISGSMATAIICHLFVKLYFEAGLEHIILEFKNEYIDDASRFWTKKRDVRGLDSGTVAVVSEDADVDSAVDTFLSASKQAPWRLRRILVQESVYQQFKDSLTWKCNLKKQESEPPASNILCSETLTYNGKVFVIDPLDLTGDQQSVVTVEAYRTRKEMISFLQKDETRYLSLWANDVAEINEVTQNTLIPLVWVNNLADFRGPPQISEAVYSHIFETEYCIQSIAIINKFYERSQSWQHFDLETRREILFDALDKYKVLGGANEHTYNEIRNSLSDCMMKSFVDVGTDYVCVGMSKPVGIEYLDLGDNSQMDEIFTVNYFKSLLYGNAFVLSVPNSTQDHIILDLFEKAGIPVIALGATDGGTGGFKIKSYCLTNTLTKVIWTNSGTIFAN